MLLLTILMLVILFAAGVVVVYVAFPHRGEEVPGAPWLGEAIGRGVDGLGDLLERPTDARDRAHADH